VTELWSLIAQCVVGGRRSAIDALRQADESERRRQRRRPRVEGRRWRGGARQTGVSRAGNRGAPGAYFKGYPWTPLSLYDMQDATPEMALRLSYYPLDTPCRTAYASELKIGTATGSGIGAGRGAGRSAGRRRFRLLLMTIRQSLWSVNQGKGREGIKERSFKIAPRLFCTNAMQMTTVIPAMPYHSASCGRPPLKRPYSRSEGGCPQCG
jgi:hypothetical protein